MINKFSKEYLWMCVSAKEIQNTKVKNGKTYLEKGDFYINSDDKQLKSKCVAFENEEFKSEDVFWIPTATQIQRLSNWEAIEITLAINEHYRCEAPYLRNIETESLEQLFLAWHMKRKTGKIWFPEMKTWQVYHDMLEIKLEGLVLEELEQMTKDEILMYFKENFKVKKDLQNYFNSLGIKYNVYDSFNDLYERAVSHILKK